MAMHEGRAIPKAGLWINEIVQSKSSNVGVMILNLQKAIEDDYRRNKIYSTILMMITGTIICMTWRPVQLRTNFSSVYRTMEDKGRLFTTWPS